MGKRQRNSSEFPRECAAAAFVLALLLGACQSAPLKAESPGSVAASPIPSASTAPSARESVEVALSTSQAKDGSLVEVFLEPSEKVEVDSVAVVFEGTDFPVFEREAGALGALVVVPFNSKPCDSKIVVTWKEKGKKGVQKSESSLKVVDGGYKSEVLKVAEDKINPPARVIKRIIAETKEIGALYRKIDTKRYWSGAFSLPIDSEVTSTFGNKRVFNGKMKSFHQGLDLRARTPTPIHAPEGAVVAMAKDLYFTGDTVILDHGHGLFTIYGHMSRLDVKPGQEVRKGEVLGLSGASGRASGPHLHWGAVLLRRKFNPQDLVQALR